MTPSKISGGSVVEGARSCPRRPTRFSQTWKKAYSLPSKRGRELLWPVFYTAAPKCVCIRRLAGARHLSPIVLWTLWPEGGPEPLTSAPRSDFMAQSLLLSIDACPGLGISPCRTNIWLSFPQPILAQDRPKNNFLQGFWKVWRVSLKFFMETSLFIVTGLRRRISTAVGVLQVIWYSDLLENNQWRTTKKLNPERYLYFNSSRFPLNRCRNEGVQTIPFFYIRMSSFSFLKRNNISRGMGGFVNNNWFGISSSQAGTYLVLE